MVTAGGSAVLRPGGGRPCPARGGSEGPVEETREVPLRVWLSAEEVLSELSVSSVVGT